MVSTNCILCGTKNGQRCCEFRLQNLFWWWCRSIRKWYQSIYQKLKQWCTIQTQSFIAWGNNGIQKKFLSTQKSIEDIVGMHLCLNEIGTNLLWFLKDLCRKLSWRKKVVFHLKNVQNNKLKINLRAFARSSFWRIIK